MVSQANTGANPWTVMVHSNNTSATLAAVVRSRRFDSIATCAKLEKSFSDCSQLVIVEHNFVLGHIYLGSTGKTLIKTGKHNGSALRQVTISVSD